MSTPHHDPPGGGGYERADAPPGALLRTALVLVALIVAAFLIARLVADGLSRQVARGEAPPHPMAGDRRPPTAALLQANPAADMASYRAQQAALETTYGWIDRDAGVVRLPVERALELVAERGLPARAEEGPR